MQITQWNPFRDMEDLFAQFPRADRISADCRDGVVTVHLPKTDIKPSKKVEIKVG